MVRSPVLRTIWLVVRESQVSKVERLASPHFFGSWSSFFNKGMGETKGSDSLMSGWGEHGLVRVVERFYLVPPFVCFVLLPLFSQHPSPK